MTLKRRLRLVKQDYEFYFEIFTYFKKEFFVVLPKLIDSEYLTYYGVYVSDLSNFDDLKQNVEQNMKKLESMFIHTLSVQIRSELNLAFLGYFYADLLEKEVDFYYKDKILPKEYKSKLKREKREGGRGDTNIRRN